MQTVGLDRSNRRILFEVRYLDGKKKIRSINVNACNVGEARKKAMPYLDMESKLMPDPSVPGQDYIRFVAFVDVP